MKKTIIAFVLALAAIFIGALWFNSWNLSPYVIIFTLASSVVVGMACVMFSKEEETEEETEEEIRMKDTSSQDEIVPPKPIDKWLDIAAKLPAKLEWARSVNVDELAQKANSTPEAVIKVAHPDLWLEFGAFTQSTEKRPLKEAIALGKKILEITGSKADIWSCFQIYMNSSYGWGEIMPYNYLRQLNREQKETLGYMISIGENVRRHLRSLTTLNQYVEATSYVPEGYWWSGNRDVNMGYNMHAVLQFQQRKEELISEGRANCKTLDDLTKFYHSFPGCPKRNELVLCTCDAHNNIAFEILEVVEKIMANATTAVQVEAVEIPRYLSTYSEGHGDLTVRLEQRKASRLKELRQQEVKAEEERIRALL